MSFSSCGAPLAYLSNNKYMCQRFLVKKSCLIIQFVLSHPVIQNVLAYWATLMRDFDWTWMDTVLKCHLVFCFLFFLFSTSHLDEWNCWNVPVHVVRIMISCAGNYQNISGGGSTSFKWVPLCRWGQCHSDVTLNLLPAVLFLLRWCGALPW